ncbi:MAG: phosphoglycerate dehydrogenase [Atopobiaceae bacterium]|jgi:D-3-phosphoglycerate dehydrogenase|nr:phosphoglycerate dehydrogenase [Atopobiaceae bacterium]
MRRIKVIDNITKNGHVEFGPGYEFTDDLSQADAILMRSSDIHDLELPPSVRAIGRAGVGVNNIPVEHCAHQGIVVFNTPGANANAVKELVIGLIMMTSRDVLGGMRWCRAHEGDPDVYVKAEKAKKEFVGREVIGRKIGVVGLGNVGSKVANACDALGMEVYGYDPYLSVEHAWQLSRSVRRVDDLTELCRGCDYLTLHVPSKEDTIGMLGAEQIEVLNDGAVLLNFARETIIDEDAVAAALESGKLSRFASDFATPKVLSMENTMVTPHAGAGTGEAEANCADMAIEELTDYLENGNITNSVNYPECHMGVCRYPGRFACLHANVPNMIGQISAILAQEDVNIQRMANEAEGPNAYTMVDTDDPLDPTTYNRLRAIEHMWRVRVIKPVPENK